MYCEWTSSSATEEELHVLGRELLHSHLVLIDSAADQSSLLFLKHDDSAFDRVLYDQTSDDTGTLLTDAVATVCALPLRRRVPPPNEAY